MTSFGQTHDSVHGFISYDLVLLCK